MRHFFLSAVVLLLSGCVGLPQPSGPSGEAGAPANFHFLKDGSLSASAEPRGESLEWLLSEKRVRVLVSLKGDAPEESKRLIAKHGATLHVFHWSASRVPPDREIEQVFRLMREATPGAPVHVFCKAGVDRTGYARAYYRYYAQGWTARQAISEMYLFLHLPNALDRDLERRFAQTPNPRPR